MSYTLNIAHLRGGKDIELDKLFRAMEEFGPAETEPVGVLHPVLGGGAILASLIRRTTRAVGRVDLETGDQSTQQVTHEDLWSFGIHPAAERLELYGGGVTAIDQVATFITGVLGCAIQVEPIELNLTTAVDRLMKNTARFQLRGVRAGDYPANPHMIGTYAPIFMDTDHGLEFMADHAEALTKVQVRWAGPSKRVTATLTPTGLFGYSCHEDDQATVQGILRKLVTG